MPFVPNRGGAAALACLLLSPSIAAGQPAPVPGPRAEVSVTELVVIAGTLRPEGARRQVRALGRRLGRCILTGDGIGVSSHDYEGQVHVRADGRVRTVTVARESAPSAIVSFDRCVGRVLRRAHFAHSSVPSRFRVSIHFEWSAGSAAIARALGVGDAEERVSLPGDPMMSRVATRGRLSEADARRAVSRIGAATPPVACFATTLVPPPGDPSLRVRIQVAADGTVRRATIREGTTTEWTTSCLLPALRTLHFPPPGSRAAVSMTLRFESSGPRRAPHGRISTGDLIVRSGPRHALFLRRQIRPATIAIRGCYERRLREAPTIAGVVIAQVVIEPSGLVSATELTRDTVGDSELAECMTRELSRTEFPIADAQTTITNTFVFSPSP